MKVILRSISYHSPFTLVLMISCGVTSPFVTDVSSRIIHHEWPLIYPIPAQIERMKHLQFIYGTRDCESTHGMLIDSNGLTVNFAVCEFGENCSHDCFR